MSDVAFHFNAPDRQGHACRLLRKAYLKGARLVALVEPEALDALDTALWTLSGGEFVPHARPGDSPAVHRRSPIVLTTEVPAAEDVPPGAVLVNLKASFPAGFEAFARVIEVVTLEESDRQQARERWRQYRAQGIEPQRHDLVSAPQS
jgi:DNA polymerase III subunit chi